MPTPLKATLKAYRQALSPPDLGQVVSKCALAALPLCGLLAIETRVCYTEHQFNESEFGEMDIRMNYTFRTAKHDEIESVFDLYQKRIRWMDEKAIHQWNTTGYLESYPVNYYRKQQALGNLYVLVEGNVIIGAVVLLQEDDRWSDKKDLHAFYVHNLVTNTGVAGAGKKLLIELEKIAFNKGICAVRLDCAVDNAFLNDYYDSLGYKVVGSCQDGTYTGNRREKILV